MSPGNSSLTWSPSAMVYSNGFNHLAGLHKGHHVLISRQDFPLHGHPLKVLRRGCSDPKWLIRQRMEHCELSRMQHGPRRVPLTVEPVAHNWMPDRCQMHSNLVCASGLQLNGNERPVHRGAKRTDRSNCALSVIAHAK